MIIIDGSYGEGGGQILRNAVAFSVLFDEKVKITNIRANRPNPGIKPQHYTCIDIIKKICSAETKGLEIGSKSLSFSPCDIKPGIYEFDIGTAGSIVLIFQAIITSLLKTRDKISIKLSGGTDVKWSPSWDYFENVYLNLIRKMGLTVKSELVSRGYYPKGGGKAIISIKPIDNIKPLNINNEQIFNDVEGIINIGNLPDHIADRMKHAAIKELIRSSFNSNIKIDSSSSLSAGVGITLWTFSEDSVMGKSMIGERGISAESIGENVSKLLIDEINSKASIDVNAIDQILPFMFLADSYESSSCLVKTLSNHLKTNIWLMNQFIKNENNINIKNENGLNLIEVCGIDYFK